MHLVAPSSRETAITVTVIHKEPLLRQGIQATLRADGRFSVRAEAQAAADAAGGVVVVADYDAGLDLARQGQRRLLIVTQRESESDVQRALLRGVLGYVLSGCRLEDIVDGVLAVHRGQRYLDQAVARRIADSLVQQALTSRESEVLGFIAAGWSNKMVANQLGVAIGTVKTHVKSILGKLDASSRTQAAMVAQHRGLVTAEVAASLSYPGFAASRRAQGGAAKMAS